MPGHKSQSVTGPVKPCLHPLSLTALGISPGVGSPECNLGLLGMDPSCAQPKPSCGQCQGVFANIQLWHRSSRSQEQHLKGAQPCPRAHHDDTWGLNPDLISSSSLPAQQNPTQAQLPQPMFCIEALTGGRLHQTQRWDFWLQDKLLPHKALRKVSDNPAAVGWSCAESDLPEGWRHLPGGFLSSDSPGSSCSRWGRARSGAQRGSSGHEGGLLTGAAGSALSPLPLSWGTNKPGSAMLQLPPQSPAAARCHPHGAPGSGRAQQSHQEGSGARGSHAGAL